MLNGEVWDEAVISAPPAKGQFSTRADVRALGGLRSAFSERQPTHCWWNDKNLGHPLAAFRCQQLAACSFERKRGVEAADYAACAVD